MRPNDFYEVERFAKMFAMAIPYNSSSGIRLAVQSYATDPRPEFMLNSYSNKLDIMNAMTFATMSGSTDTGAALSELRNVMFTEQNGDRPEARNVGIFITDGKSNDRQSTFNEAVSTRNEGVTLMTVGVGIESLYNLREMYGITSDPDDVNFINADSYQALMELADSVLSTVCNGTVIFHLIHSCIH